MEFSPELASYTWHWHGNPALATVTVTCHSVPGGRFRAARYTTLVHFTHGLLV